MQKALLQTKLYFTMRDVHGWRVAVAIVSFFVVFLVILFRPTLFGGKTLFPANLLYASYVPWKYEPVAGFPHGPPNKPLGFDDIRQFFPNRVLLKDALSRAVVPLWNPYIYAGTPFEAAFDTSVWYPVSWIASMLPPIHGWDFLVIVQPTLSLFFMYLFLRSLKLNKPVSVYGAFAWAFSGFMVVYWQEILVLEHSFLWLPLALYASNRLWDKKSDTLVFLLLILSLSCSIFGGFLQMSLYVYGMFIVWNILRAVEKKFLPRSLIVGFFVSLFLSGVQLIPSIEAFLQSPRGLENGLVTFQKDLVPLQHILTILVPDFWGNPATYNYFGGQGFYFEKMIFIGVIPLLFALYAMSQWHERMVRFWAIVAVVALSFGFAIPTSWLPYILRIPVLSNSYPTRIFGVSAFALTVLSAYGLAAFLKKPLFKWFLGIVVGCLAIVGVGWIVAVSAWCVSHLSRWCNGKAGSLFEFIGHLPDVYRDRLWYANVSLHNLYVPTVFLLLLIPIFTIVRHYKKLFYASVFMLTVVGSWYFAQKYLSFSDTKFVYPRLSVISELSSIAGYDRVWGYGNAFITPDIQQYFRWYTTDGYGNLSPIRYAQLLSTIINQGKLGGFIRRSDTDIYETSERDSMASNTYRLRMMSLFGVRYVLEAKAGDLKDTQQTAYRFPSTLFTLMWEDPAWRIWRYNDALPRVFVATRVCVLSNPQSIVDALYDQSTDLSQTVILEKNPRVLVAPVVASSSATIVSYRLNDVVVAVTASTAGFLVLSDNYYPGWNAEVNGQKSELYRADYTLRAVYIPAGKSTVIFHYQPTSFAVGVITSACGILGAFVWLLTRRRNT